MKNLKEITASIIEQGYRLTMEEAMSLWFEDYSVILSCASAIREHFKGNEVKLCGIVNAKSGDCPEDCKFCAQSAHNKAVIEKYPVINFETLRSEFEKAVLNGASCFGVVTSGKKLEENEIDELCSMLKQLDKSSINISVSPGMVSKEALRKLKNAGIRKIHHNLETSESFFPEICSTHSFNEKANFVKDAKDEGFDICCGALFGLGENFSQRIELAFTLRDIDVDSVPLNFFNPIAGTALEKVKPLSAEEILRTVAMYRVILFDKDIRVCGGREVNLKDMQDKIFAAGANGMMVGGYLTTGGRPVNEDIGMIQKLGLTLHKEA